MMEPRTAELVEALVAAFPPEPIDGDWLDEPTANWSVYEDRLDRGDVNDADKDRLKQTIADLKEELDAREERATRSIPLTERTRDDALRLRRDLLDKLAGAQKEQAEAKAKREANPDDSSAQSEYERATQEMCEAEKALEQFNDKYGQDIERHASRLIEHYRDEKQSHERPLTEAKNRSRSASASNV